MRTLIPFVGALPSGHQHLRMPSHGGSGLQDRTVGHAHVPFTALGIELQLEHPFPAAECEQKPTSLHPV